MMDNCKDNAAIPSLNRTKIFPVNVETCIDVSGDLEQHSTEMNRPGIEPSTSEQAKLQEEEEFTATSMNQESSYPKPQSSMTEDYGQGILTHDGSQNLENVAHSSSTLPPFQTFSDVLTKLSAVSNSCTNLSPPVKNAKYQLLSQPHLNVIDTQALGPSTGVNSHHGQLQSQKPSTFKTPSAKRLKTILRKKKLTEPYTHTITSNAMIGLPLQSTAGVEGYELPYNFQTTSGIRAPPPSYEYATASANRHMRGPPLLTQFTPTVPVGTTPTMIGDYSSNFGIDPTFYMHYLRASTSQTLPTIREHCQQLYPNVDSSQSSIYANLDMQQELTQSSSNLPALPPVLIMENNNQQVYSNLPPLTYAQELSPLSPLLSMLPTMSPSTQPLQFEQSQSALLYSASAPTSLQSLLQVEPLESVQVQQLLLPDQQIEPPIIKPRPVSALMLPLTPLIIPPEVPLQQQPSQSDCLQTGTLQEPAPTPQLGLLQIAPLAKPLQPAPVLTLTPSPSASVEPQFKLPQIPKPKSAFKSKSSRYGSPSQPEFPSVPGQSKFVPPQFAVPLQRPPLQPTILKFELLQIAPPESKPLQHEPALTPSPTVSEQPEFKLPQIPKPKSAFKSKSTQHASSSESEEFLSLPGPSKPASSQFAVPSRSTASKSKRPKHSLLSQPNPRCHPNYLQRVLNCIQILEQEELPIALPSTPRLLSFSTLRLFCSHYGVVYPARPCFRCCIDVYKITCPECRFCIEFVRAIMLEMNRSKISTVGGLEWTDTPNKILTILSIPLVNCTALVLAGRTAERTNTFETIQQRWMPDIQARLTDFLIRQDQSTHDTLSHLNFLITFLSARIGAFALHERINLNIFGYSNPRFSWKNPQFQLSTTQLLAIREQIRRKIASEGTSSRNRRKRKKGNKHTTTKKRKHGH